MDSKLEQQREHFNKISTAYLEGKADQRYLKLQSLIWADVFRNIEDLKQGGVIDVLEPMCGFAEGGRLLKKFDTHMEYLGFDYSEDVVKKASQVCPSFTVIHADVTKFDSKRKFDLIILIGGLHHVPDYAPEVVQRLTKLLKPGGLFINFEPTNGNWLARLVRERIYNRNEIFDSETERAFSVSELKNIFRNAGLGEKFVMFPGLLSYILYYNPYAFPFLNRGSTGLVDFLYKCERPFRFNLIGRFFSFCTLSVWVKSD